MPKHRLVLIMAIAVAVLGFSILFLTIRPGANAKVRLLKSQREGPVTVVSFEVLDGTSHEHLLTPVRLEIRDETGWKECPDKISGFSEPPIGTNTITSHHFYLGSHPPGSHLRLVVDVNRQRLGLGTLWARLKLRLVSHNQQVSLNPFDSSFHFFSKEMSNVMTDEFLEP